MDAHVPQRQALVRLGHSQGQKKPAPDHTFQVMDPAPALSFPGLENSSVFKGYFCL